MRATQQLRITVLSSWAPIRDGSGNITNFASLPLRTWIEVPGSQFYETIKPILDAGGYTLHNYGNEPMEAVITNYNGMAWDFANGRGWANGGGHHGGVDNGVYKLDTNKMRWSVEIWPSKVGSDGLTAEDARCFEAVPQTRMTSQTFVADGQVRKKPNARSSTGFVVYLGNPLSQVQWKECLGPEGPIADQDEWTSIWNSPTKTPLDYAGSYSIMFDGRPVARHNYEGFVYSALHDEVVGFVRQIFRGKLDGTGWITYHDGGITENGRYSGELAWVAHDPVNNVLYRGGCGSDCGVGGYYYYRNCVKVDLATLAESDFGPIVPDGVSNSLANAGDLMMMPFQHGRWFGGWCTTNYGWRCHFDTGQRELLSMIGTPYAGTTGEGRRAIYIPSLGKMWLFDTSQASLPVWECDIDEGTPGGPNGATMIQARTLSLANAAALPLPVNFGKTYNRLSYWEQKGILVYAAPNAHANAWVCRLE